MVLCDYDYYGNKGKFDTSYLILREQEQVWHYSYSILWAQG